MLKIGMGGHALDITIRLLSIYLYRQIKQTRYGVESWGIVVIILSCNLFILLIFF